MRKYFSLFAASLLLAAITIVSAQAKTETATFQISDPVTVGGVVLEKGHYTFKFNDKTNELTIRRNDRTVATVKAKVIETNSKVRTDTFISSVTDAGRILTGVRFAGKTTMVVPEATS
jgi:hypothetical protein